MFKRLLAAVLALMAATAFAAVDVNKASVAELEARLEATATTAAGKT